MLVPVAQAAPRERVAPTVAPAMLGAQVELQARGDAPARAEPLARVARPAPAGRLAALEEPPLAEALARAEVWNPAPAHQDLRDARWRLCPRTRAYNG